MINLTTNSRCGRAAQMTRTALLTTALLAAGIGAQAQIYTDGAAYDNTENFTGFSVSPGGATTANKITNLLLDDLTYSPTYEGVSLTSFSFAVGNTNAAAVSARAKLRFYLNDGSGGGPGTLFAAFNFNPISFAAGVTTFTDSGLTAGQFVLPTTTSTIWAGISYDAVGTTATAAQLNKLGIGTFNPPTVGSSADEEFGSSGTPGQFLTNNPAGSIAVAPFEPTVVANFGFRLGVQATPEPGPVAMFVGLGVSSLAVLRRRKSVKK